MQETLKLDTITFLLNLYDVKNLQKWGVSEDKMIIFVNNEMTLINT